MNNNDLVAKLWKLCDNLRDGGVFLSKLRQCELASLLFLENVKKPDRKRNTCGRPTAGTT